jgi:VWFA-related protein
MKSFPLAVVLLVLAVSPLAAQRYDDTVTVNVVEVPVYVERFGHPIAGLTRDDFELFVNGQPRPIEYFDVLEERSDVRTPKAERAAPAPFPAPAELKRRRLVVLLFDIGGSSAYALQRARIKAVQYLEESGDGDTYAVATIGRSGVRFLVPFTTDRVAIARAPSEAADPFRVATLDVERTAWREAVLGGAEAGLGSAIDIWGAGPRGGFSNSRSVMSALDSYDTMLAWEESERYVGDWHLVDALGNLADRLAPLSGVKHVVLLSERPGVSDAASVYQPVMRIHTAENTDDDSLFLADTLLNDIPQRGVTLSLDAKGSRITASIPGPELLAQPSDKPLPLDVFFYVFDEKGQATAWNQIRINVDLVVGRDFLEAHPYTIRQEFLLEPGRYAAKALVRIAGTDMTGFRRTDFVIQ